jgi:glycosyltransferase involved in cell wall biosynthesis
VVDKNLISVVIPTYNREQAVCKTLESLIAQTHQNWEALVIDDGSKDNTKQVIAQRFPNEPRIRYVYQQNGGAPSARNHGMEIAQGDFIAFLDSDDTWEPWKMELQLACFAKEPEIGMVWTNMASVDAYGNVMNPLYLATMYRSRRLYSDAQLFDRSHTLESTHASVNGLRMMTGNIFSFMVTGSLVHTSTVMLRRAWQKRVGLFNLEYKPLGEDFDYHLRTTKLGRVGFVNVASVRYQIGMPGALTERKNIVYAAKNFLGTIEPYIQNERHNIHLSDGEIKDTLAFGYRWYGTELVLSGKSTEARRALWRSLGERWSNEAALFFALSLLPMSVLQMIRTRRAATRPAGPPPVMISENGMA